MTGAGGRGELVVLPDSDALAREAAEDFTRRALAALAARSRFAVALSGGQTPRRLYRLLAEEPYRSRVPWTHTHLFWGDERHVGPEDPRSNFRMVREALLSRITVPEENVHRIPAEISDASEAAAQYEAEMRRFFGLAPAGIPEFDLMYLGLGEEGHTASLFPDNPALSVRDRLVVAAWVASLEAFRITLTYPVFDRARAVVFLVSGPEKAEILAAVRDPARASAFPAGRIQPREGELVWLVDRAATGSTPAS